MPPPTLLLASASPRRKALLSLVMQEFTTRAVALREDPHSGEMAPQYVGRIAKEKALKALEEIRPGDPDWLLTADTTVFLANEPTRMFGKPESENEAKEFLRHLSGKPHVVMTGFCLAHTRTPDRLWLDRLVRSTVVFRKLHEREIEAYVATNEWRDKAGGYGIQGEGGVLVETIEGSYSNIIGLPVTEVIEGFKTLNVPGWWNP